MIITMVANSAFTLTNFRSELISSLINDGHQLFALCPAECNLMDDNVKKSFDSMGVTFIPIDLQRNGTNPLDDFRFLWGLIRHFKSIKPDIVLNYTIKPFIYSSIAAKLIGSTIVSSNVTGLGYIFTENSLKVKLLRALVKMQLKLAARCNNVIFFQNPDDRNEYYHHQIITQKTKNKVINGSGINLSKFEHSPKAASKVTVFLFIARLLKDKGVNEYISAARAVKAIDVNTKFILIGPIDSNPSSLSQEYIDSLHFEGVIEYRGATSDVIPHIIESDIFVLPSYREGTPRTVLEAMAVGRPVITTDAPGCKECVEDSYNGYLVPIKSTHHLIQSMLKLSSNPELRIKMGRNSRKIAEEKYDVNLTIAEVRGTLGI